MSDHILITTGHLWKPPRSGESLARAAMVRSLASGEQDAGASGYPPIVAPTIVRQLLSKVQHLKLIGVLPHEAPVALGSIGRLYVPVQGGRELVKRGGQSEGLVPATWVWN